MMVRRCMCGSQPDMSIYLNPRWDKAASLHKHGGVLSVTASTDTCGWTMVQHVGYCRKLLLLQDWVRMWKLLKSSQGHIIHLPYLQDYMGHEGGYCWVTGTFTARVCNCKTDCTSKSVNQATGCYIFFFLTPQTWWKQQPNSFQTVPLVGVTWVPGIYTYIYCTY